MVNLKRFAFLLVLLSLWLAACSGSAAEPGNAPNEQVQLGERLFIQNCAACHATAPETIIVGPSLAGLPASAAARVAGQDAYTYIEASILEPDAYINAGFKDIMPKTFGKTLTGEEVDALIAYLFTLE